MLHALVVFRMGSSLAVHSRPEIISALKYSNSDALSVTDAAACYVVKANKKVKRMPHIWLSRLRSRKQSPNHQIDLKNGLNLYFLGM